MNSRLADFTRGGFVVASLAVFSFFGYGCGGNNNSATLIAQFTASTTPTSAAVHLIKLIPNAASGARVVIQAVIYGQDVTLDMYTFAFDVKIGDASVLAFVPSSAVAGNALTAIDGQTITAIAAADMSDPSHIVVAVSKLGPGPGNGVEGSSAIIVSMAFDVLKQGTSTLAIATAPAPAVIDQSGVAIDTITFDAASGSVTGISSGGGGY